MIADTHIGKELNLLKVHVFETADDVVDLDVKIFEVVAHFVLLLVPDTAILASPAADHTRAVLVEVVRSDRDMLWWRRHDCDLYGASRSCEMSGGAVKNSEAGGIADDDA